MSDLKLYFELGATRNYYELSFYHLYLESEKYTSKLSVINWLNGEVVYSRVIKISDFENTNKTSISLKALDEASKILDVIDTDCNIIKRFVSKIKQRF
ncbi:MAG: hypothetical protein A2355_17545 [Spirochaetes bacterium RIFOXYB1_FULL_32_8]|nr:MAG: hypothetical protein A2355_17545 [Spirochaetes bacterium RIFOXYB1_FULL_32_8]